MSLRNLEPCWLGGHFLCLGKQLLLSESPLEAQFFWVCGVLSATLARQPETDFTYLLDILPTNCLDKVLNYAGLGGLCPW